MFGGSTNLVVILFMMQVSKKIPFDDPMVLNGVRLAYVLSNVIIVAAYLYIQTQINKKKGMPLLRFIIDTYLPSLPALIAVMAPH